MKKFWNEFKKFISRGNVVDMAIGVIIASAFTAIVTAVTNKIIMPVVNWILAIITGGSGLDQIYTFLKKVYVPDASGNPTTQIDLANSIYIDWGALITSIINFFIIALILFIMLKAFNAAQDGIAKEKNKFPTIDERKELKAKGVDVLKIKRKELIAKTAELRAEKKAIADAKAQAEKKPTTEELLTDILAELKQSRGELQASSATDESAKKDKNTKNDADKNSK